MENLQNIFNAQKSHFHQVIKHQPISDRILKLKKLKSWIVGHQQDIRDALYTDFQKPGVEADITDIKIVLNEIDHACHKLFKWAWPKRVRTPLFMTGTRSKIRYEPKGVVLIIAPWNFPFMLPVSPLVSAIATGNCAIVKPSELSPATSDVVKKMVEELFEPKEICVIPGDAKTGQSLVELPFDHIFFTGSERVGKIVMQTAAKNLTSVTLELGGQNPVIVDESAKINEAAERIVQGKFFNAGQSCVSANTVYTHKSVFDSLLNELKFYINSYYPNGYDHPDYTMIVNQTHYHRLKELLDDAIVKGARAVHDENTWTKEKIFAPVILTNVSNDAKILNEEIFGPILVVLPYKNIEQVIEILNAKPKPLALYIFSQYRKKVNYIIKNVTSGTVTVNSTAIQFMQYELPFGGVGNSGIGRAHGYYGFLDFSIQRSILKQKNGLTGFKFFRPPYSEKTKNLVKLFMKYL